MTELERKIEELENMNQELTRENLEMKERLERLSGEMEEMKGVEADMNQRFEEMEKEIEEYEEEKKALESISTRAVELETEVSNLQDDLITSVAEVDKTAEEVAELKKALAEKGVKLEGYEKEAEGLRKDRAEVEKRVRDLERKIGVLEVREMEEKSKKLRLEEEMREKEREIEELQKKVSVLNVELVKNGEELAKCKSVKKLTEAALSESKKREKEMELKKNELLKKVEEGNKTIFGLKERTMKPSNGVRDTKASMEAEFQWPVVAAGSVGAAGLVAATLFMWWADLKAAVGQRINVEGIVSSISVVARDRQLVLPHVSVKDLRYIDWGELKRKGFKGVVFDKDNTLTAPYSLAIWPPLRPSIERCKAVFGHDIAVFSNSAGFTEYDHDDSKAKALEAEIGIRVLRHRVKKPAGTAEEVEKHFGCASSELIMVGDRPFTDIVYGNRNGFLTVLTEPFSRAEEPFIVRQVRRLELALLKRWLRKGLKPVDHSLVSDVAVFVKDPSGL